MIAIFRMLEKVILVTCAVIVIVVAAAWFWEDYKTDKLLNDTMQALHDGRKPADILLTYTEDDIRIEPGSSYEIINRDKHFYWGQWYCIRLDNAIELLVDVYPGLIDSHRIMIGTVDSCR